jgi:hypothetical protein
MRTTREGGGAGIVAVQFDCPDGHQQFPGDIVGLGEVGEVNALASASCGAPNRRAIPVNRPRAPDYQAKHRRKNRGSEAANRRPA